MKNLIFATCLVSSFGISGFAWAQNPIPTLDCAYPFTPVCIPNANEVCIFIDTCFHGSYRRLQLGSYPSMTGDAITLPNDSLSSFCVGSGVTFEIFEHGNFGGLYDVVNGPSQAPYVCYNIPLIPQDALNAFYHIRNDEVSSAKVIPNCMNPPAQSCSFFTGQYYTGLCTTLAAGTYANSSQIGLPDKSIVSVRCYAAHTGNSALDTALSGYAYLFGAANFGNLLWMVAHNYYAQLPNGVSGQISSVYVW